MSKKPIEEIMKDIDKNNKDFIEIFQAEVVKVLVSTLDHARNRFYDAVVYFNYSIMMIKQFGDNGSIVISPEILASRGTGKRYRIDEVNNDDGSKTLTMIEIPKEENDEN